jgi:hypothetical protein
MFSRYTAYTRYTGMQYIAKPECLRYTGMQYIAKPECLRYTGMLYIAKPEWYTSILSVLMLIFDRILQLNFSDFFENL